MGAVGGKTTTVVMMQGPSRIRIEAESESPDVPKSKFLSVDIWDRDQRLHLDTEKKLATVYDYIDRAKDQTPEDADLLRAWRRFFSKLRRRPRIRPT